MQMVIKTPAGFIIGFCEEHQVIQVTQDKCSAMKFDDIDSVEDFVNEYADAGYGFVSSNYTIENV
jgi:hypothetical protein